MLPKQYTNIPIRLFFDMDNVLNIFEDNPSKHELCHYFRKLKPNPQMQELIQTSSLVQNDSYILGHIADTSAELLAENTYDKHIWTILHFPEFPIERKLFVPKSISKSKAVSILLNKTITKADILIDDYNPNLLEWRNAGGTAVKYINDDNSIDSYNGPHITKNMSIQDIEKLFVNSIYGKPTT